MHPMLGGNTKNYKHTYTYLRLEQVITIVISMWFSAGFRPHLAPRPVPTGRARKMVQNEPTLAPETNAKAVSRPFSGPHPKLKIQNAAHSEGKYNGLSLAPAGSLVADGKNPAQHLTLGPVAVKNHGARKGTTHVFKR